MKGTEHEKEEALLEQRGILQAFGGIKFTSIITLSIMHCT